jgi:hypothetical protein
MRLETQRTATVNLAAAVLKWRVDRQTVQGLDTDPFVSAVGGNRLPELIKTVTLHLDEVCRPRRQLCRACSPLASLRPACRSRPLDGDAGHSTATSWAATHPWPADLHHGAAALWFGARGPVWRATLQNLASILAAAPCLPRLARR